MNSIEFANYLNERDDNDGVKHSIPDALIEKMQGFMEQSLFGKVPWA